MLDVAIAFIPGAPHILAGGVLHFLLREDGVHQIDCIFEEALALLLRAIAQKLLLCEGVQGARIAVRSASKEGNLVTAQRKSLMGRGYDDTHETLDAKNTGKARPAVG